MSTYVGLILLAIVVFILHIGFQPYVKAQQTPYQAQLQAMLDECSSIEECSAIQNVINRGAK